MESFLLLHRTNLYLSSKEKIYVSCHIHFCHTPIFDLRSYYHMSFDSEYSDFSEKNLAETYFKIPHFLFSAPLFYFIISLFIYFIFIFILFPSFILFLFLFLFHFF